GVGRQQCAAHQRRIRGNDHLRVPYRPRHAFGKRDLRRNRQQAAGSRQHLPIAKPAFQGARRAGDTVHAIVAVTELLSKRSRVLLSTECTVRGVVVISGEALVLLPGASADHPDPRAGRTHDRLNPWPAVGPVGAPARPYAYSIEQKDDRFSLEIANGRLPRSEPETGGSIQG